MPAAQHRFHVELAFEGEVCFSILFLKPVANDGFDPLKMRLPPEQWYPAADGLKTVRALAEHVTANLNDFKQPNPILRDLKAAEVLLAAAEAAGVRFHFTKAVV